jgi:hypothetical protein
MQTGQTKENWHISLKAVEMKKVRKSVPDSTPA